MLCRVISRQPYESSCLTGSFAFIDANTWLLLIVIVDIFQESKVLRQLKSRCIVLLIILVLPSIPSQVRALEAIRIGWIGWADTEVTIEIAKHLLERHLNQPVKLVDYYSIGLQYKDLAKGDIDLMLAAWIPLHQMFIDKIARKIEDLGVLYDHARIGWIVPGYVPENKLQSIEDLRNPEVYEKLQGEIHGIEPDSGLMYLSERALRTYGLDGYELIPADEGDMIADLNEALENNDWIVVTGWSPHWMFAYWDLRYLEDPKKVLDGEQSVHALGRQGFRRDFPDVARFLRNFKIPLGTLEEIMLMTTEVPVEEAVNAYLKNRPEFVEQRIEFLMPTRTP